MTPKRPRKPATILLRQHACAANGCNRVFGVEDGVPACGAGCFKLRGPTPPTDLSAPAHLDMAESYLKIAARHIDTAGELAGTDQADMLACYASNVLQGSLSLIRELRRAIATSGKAPGRP